MTNEQAYFIALKRIAAYMDLQRLKKVAQSQYGLTDAEAVEYAYENVLDEARSAIRGKRMPKERK